MRNGEADGVPDLPRALQAEWAEVMAVEFTRLQRASRRRRDTLIDPYGASEPAEFFAVVTESFFDAPIDLKRNHRRLYDLLCRYYRRDPATALGDRT
jgi:Mlc titration factor MtfA (ptsG expression regulator)